MEGDRLTHKKKRQIMRQRERDERLELSKQTQKINWGKLKRELGVERIKGERRRN